jgi:hypothetical protein
MSLHGVTIQNTDILNKRDEWLRLLLCIRMSQVQILAHRPAILTEGVHGFPQSLQVNTGVVP